MRDNNKNEVDEINDEITSSLTPSDLDRLTSIVTKLGFRNLKHFIIGHFITPNGEVAKSPMHTHVYLVYGTLNAGKTLDENNQEAKKLILHVSLIISGFLSRHSIDTGIMLPIFRAAV